jgi:hypothetical protein
MIFTVRQTRRTAFFSLDQTNTTLQSKKKEDE